jgi:ABC-type amino acid transport system permease subunit
MTPHSFTVTGCDVAELRETFSDDMYGDTLTGHLRARRGEGLALSQYRLTRVVKLYDRVRKLAGEPRYARFFAEAEAEFDELEKRAVDFLRRSASSLTIAERLHRLDDDYEELMQERRDTFARDCRDLFIALARFLAHAVLRSEASEKAILRRLRETGFAAAEPMNLPQFPIDSLTVLALGVLVYLAVVSLFFEHMKGLPADEPQGLIIALKVWFVRLTPICATVWLMQRCSFFRRDTGEPLRYSAYFVNALVASGIAVAVAVAFYFFGADAPADLRASAVRDRPLILLTFPLAFAVALCCDDWVEERPPPWWLRIAEAAGCGFLMGAATVLLYFENLMPFANALSDWKLPLVLAMPAAMAVVIGGSVPDIYRSARRAASARRAEASRPAAAELQAAPQLREVAAATAGEPARAAGP